MMIRAVSAGNRTTEPFRWAWSGSVGVWGDGETVE
jgi:hypothetical protein